MCKALVIVESPAKAKTINKYLGNNYVVKSSIGHIRDLPKSSGYNSQKNINSANKVKKVKKNEHEALINRMGVDPYHGWKANYQILPGKEKVVNELKLLASDAEHIYLATDLDREGEAIAWHLREVIGGDNQRFSRIVFNEITKNAIKQAFDNPAELNIYQVNAQQTRRFLDRIVGYMVSPLLWKKIARGLSAGRVQSVAVRLIVEREREIKAFIPQEYWQLHAELLAVDIGLIRMEVTQNGKIFKPTSKVQIDAAIALLSNACYQVSNREDRPIITKPTAPFITSTLQQAASTSLGFSVKKTMIIAQQLYEAGYITYMRTDSTNLSQDALTMARDYIAHKFGKKYLPREPNMYINQKSSQEAHEAIRPSNIEVNVNSLSGMNLDAKKLYQLIWNQFIACQMTPAKFDSTTLIVKAGNFELKAKWRTLRFDGWIKVMSISHKDNKNKILPMIKIGNQLKLKKLSLSQHFTKPPARFSEASLVRELEKRRIGRPSTYPVIISTIQDRGYVKIENRRFYAEKIGEIVTDRLDENFTELMNYDFTAQMEDQLDLIAKDRIEWKSVLDNFFATFSKQLKNANKPPEEGGMRPNLMVLTSIDCPDCHQKMGIRTASTGVFLGCSGYYRLPEKKYCKKSINLIPENKLSNILFVEEKDAETHALRACRRCPKCATAMDSYFIDNKSKLHICGNNPTCNGYEIEEGKFSIKGYDGPLIKCDKCGLEMDFKISRFGKYMKCTNDACKNTRKILKSGKIAPPKENPIPLPELVCEKSDAYFVLRDGAAGIFLAANTFPKSRETRAPLVEELVRFKDHLPAKFNYLTLAPLKDPKGNKTIVKFSRKTKQQYISSEKNGKPTGWSIFYIDGKWIEK